MNSSLDVFFRNISIHVNCAGKRNQNLEALSVETIGLHSFVIAWVLNLKKYFKLALLPIEIEKNWKSSAKFKQRLDLSRVIFHNFFK